MSTVAMRRRAIAKSERSLGVDWVQLRWLALGYVVGFLVPFVLADQLDLPRDIYYGLYSFTAVGLFVLWARATDRSVESMIRRRWILAVALGLVAAAVLALVVLRTENETSRPDGLTLVGAVAWRGVVYGIADGVLLSAFPILVVYAAFATSALNERRLGRLAVGMAALAASVVMTATYHFGYDDFRSGKVRSPIAGDVMWSVPTLVTLNPIGAPIAHAGLHVAAVLHSYETDVFLPPHSSTTRTEAGTPSSSSPADSAP